MAQITAGVLLNLKDQFSSRIKGAGISVEGFANQAVGVANRVNQAFSGLAGTLGTLGVSIGALSAFKGVIDMDHRMARLGLTANLSAREVNELKRTIFDVAQMPDIKLSTDPIIAGLDVMLEKIGDAGLLSKENIVNLARAIQAAGADGAAMGDVFSEFTKNKFSDGEITRLMDDLITISDMGEYTFAHFARTGKSVLSSYSLIGNTPEDVRNAYVAMQILAANTKSADVAATVLDSTMRELVDPKKRQALENLGVTVRDNVTGEMRDFNNILADVAVVYNEELWKADVINSIFGSETQRAIRAYGSEFAKTIPKMKELGDTSGTLAGKSAKMANTMKSNLQNLQTAFESFADKGLSGPLQNLTNLLNKLAEDPEKIEAGIRGITSALLKLGALKLGAGLVSFVANLKSIQGGQNISQALSGAAGGAGIPVHVTNWGGAAGSSMPQNPKGGDFGSPVSTGVPELNPRTNNAANFARGARSAGLITTATVGITQGIGAYQRIKEIDADTEMSSREKSMAKGETLGGAIGTTVGTGTGVLAGSLLAGKVGAMIGTALAPGIGTAIGGGIGMLGGALVGWLGGMAGKKAGKAIGSAVAEEDMPVNDLIVTPQGKFSTHPDDYIFAMKNPASLFNAVSSVPPVLATPSQAGGEIILRSELVIDDAGYRLKQSAVKNTTPYKFTVGSSQNARLVQ